MRLAASRRGSSQRFSTKLNASAYLIICKNVDLRENVRVQQGSRVQSFPFDLLQLELSNVLILLDGYLLFPSVKLLMLLVEVFDRV